MLFNETAIPGVWLIEPEPSKDNRGYFMRTYCAEEFSSRGIGHAFVQHSTSYTAMRGSIRGMHFQKAPHEEAKVVTCRRGAIFDVVLDLRSNSPTYCRWLAFELTGENRLRVYIPEGCAHGFQTLTGDVEIDYLISQPYAPHAAAGVRFDDPAFGIVWPLPVTVVSEKDKSWSSYDRMPCATEN